MSKRPPRARVCLGRRARIPAARRRGARFNAVCRAEGTTRRAARPDDRRRRRPCARPHHRKELGLDGKLVSIDGVQLRELDYVDIGELLDPPGVVPVVIKSLLFS